MVNFIEMENILNFIILITLCVGLTILFIKESDNIKGKSKDDLNFVNDAIKDILVT